MWSIRNKEIALRPRDLKQEKLEETILVALQKLTLGSTISDSSLIVNDLGLEIKLSNIKEHDIYIQGNIILKHKMFNHNVIDTATGIGKTTEAKVKQFTTKLALSTLFVIIAALGNNPNKKLIEIPYADRISKLSLFYSPLSAQGKINSDPIQDYWSILGDEISKRLGNEKFNFVIIYASKNNSEVTCRCVINDRIDKDLTNMLYTIVNDWNLQTPVYSEKQCFVLIQDNNTYKPFKYITHNIKIFTEKTMDYFYNCHTQEDYQQLPNRIYMLTEDIHLTTELYNLIPEILCELIYDEVTYSNYINIDIKGKNTITVHKQQLSSYYDIHRSVYNCFVAKKDPELIERILAKSTYIKAIAKKLDSGYKFEDIELPSLTIHAPEEYECY